MTFLLELVLAKIEKFPVWEKTIGDSRLNVRFRDGLYWPYIGGGALRPGANGLQTAKEAIAVCKAHETANLKARIVRLNASLRETEKALREVEGL